MKDEKPLISASDIVNVADDWFPSELKLMDLVDEGIVVIGPFFKKDVETSGLSLEVKTLSNLGGNANSFADEDPIMFNSTLPTFDEFFEIKLLI